MVKILFFTRKFHPSIGGVEKHCLEIGKRLVKKGYKVTVVAEISNDVGKQEDRNEKVFGMKIYRIPLCVRGRLKKFQIWFWLLRNSKLIKKADVIHCHDVFFWYIPFYFLFPKKKVFATFHGWEGTFPPTPKAILVRKISEKLSKGNICIGEYIKRWYGTEPDFVVYGGIDVKQRIVNQRLKDRITFIGRLDEDTGLPIYINVINELNKLLPGKFKFVFLGSGELEREAKKVGKVRGFIKNVWPEILRSKFILCSSYLSMLESILGKRIIFSVYGNKLKEDYLMLSPFSKFIVIESDPEKLAEKIIYYYNHPKEEKKLVEAGYKWAVQQTWDKVVDVYLKLWQK